MRLLALVLPTELHLILSLISGILKLKLRGRKLVLLNKETRLVVDRDKPKNSEFAVILTHNTGAQYENENIC